MDFSTILLNMSSTAAQGGTAGAGNSAIWMIALMIFFVVYIFFLTRKEKKQKKSEDEMRDSLKIGDEIVTIGGIMGRIVTVKDDSIILETGADRNKIRFTKQAVATNLTANARIEDAKKAKMDAATKAAQDKKKNKNKKK